MNIRTLLVSTLIALTTFTCQAQIQLSPLAFGNVEGLNENTANILEGKLRNLLTQKGIMSKFGDSRFVLAANMSILDKEILGTAPTKICYRLNIQLAVGDGVSGSCYGTMSQEVKGVGSTEIKAVTNAIKALNTRNPKFGELVETGTQKIYEYYEKNAAKIVQTANSLAQSGKYDEAILELAAIPKEVKEYAIVNEALTQINKDRINHNAAKILTEAKAAWAGNPTPENGECVMAIIQEIDPSSKVYPEAKSFISSVEAKISKINRQEKADAIAMEKARLKAIENVAVAEAKSRPKVVYNVSTWWW